VRYKKRRQRGDNAFYITSDMAEIGQQIPIYDDHRIDPLELSSYHKVINRKQFKNASFIDRRLAIQRMFLEVLRTRDHPDHYPEDILRQSYHLLTKHSLNTFLSKGGVRFSTSIIRQMTLAWRRLIEHFFKPSSGLTKGMLWRGINIVCNQVFTPISVARIRWKATKQLSVGIYNPLAYAALLQRLQVKGNVIDLNPGFGHKAIACALLGLRYITPACPEMARAVELGILDMIGLDYQILDDQQADLLISDDNFHRFVLPTDRELLRRAKKMVAFAPGVDKIALVHKYKPTSLIKIFCKFKLVAGKISPDFVMVW
jgi:hypothetical protein